MKRFRQLVEHVAHYLALIGFSGLLILAIMVVADIVLRALFDFPLKGVNDVAAIVMAVVVSACIPKSLLLKQNISIEVLGQSLGHRARHALESFAALAVMVFFILMVWQFIPYAQSVTASGQTTWVLKLPVGPWWWLATAFFGVAVLAQLAVFFTDVSLMLSDKPGSAAADEQEGVL